MPTHVLTFPWTIFQGKGLNGSIVQIKLYGLWMQVSKGEASCWMLAPLRKIFSFSIFNWSFVIGRGRTDRVFFNDK